MPKRQRDLQRRALDESRLTLDDIAEAVEMSRSSVEKYRLDPGSEDRIPMPAEVARRLSTFLRSHAEELGKIADDLEKFAG